MRKIVAVGVFGILFAITMPTMGFELKINRDPFMDLLKYRELQMKEVLLKKKSEIGYLQQEIEALKSSLEVKMVVTSKVDPESKAALLVGPSGIPIVVMKGYELKSGVYVKDIKDDGVEIEIRHGKNNKTVVLKITK